MGAADFDRELDIQASDINGDMIDMAKLNAQQAGLLHSIRFKQLAVKDFSTTRKTGSLLPTRLMGSGLAIRPWCANFTRKWAKPLRR